MLQQNISNKSQDFYINYEVIYRVCCKTNISTVDICYAFDMCAALDIFLLHKNSICFASETMVPSTIPPELYFINQFITRGKYIKNNKSIQEWSPSLPQAARRIGFATLQLNCAVRIYHHTLDIDAYPTVLSFSVLRFELST